VFGSPTQVSPTDAPPAPISLTLPVPPSQRSTTPELGAPPPGFASYLNPKSLLMGNLISVEDYYELTNDPDYEPSRKKSSRKQGPPGGPSNDSREPKSDDNNDGGEPKSDDNNGGGGHSAAST
jgi:hypothetical protein